MAETLLAEVTNKRTAEFTSFHWSELLRGNRYCFVCLSALFFNFVYLVEEHSI